MANNNNDQSLINAVEVIERFGGLRPMSTKTNIPVTTIQGWKKRNAIPVTRTDEILKAAREHDVDLSGLVSGGDAAAVSAKLAKVEAAKSAAPANVATPPADVSEAKIDMADDYGRDDAPAFLGGEESNTPDDKDFTAVLAKVEKKAMGRSAFLTIGILAIALGGVAWALNQKFTVSHSSMKSVERDLIELEEEVDTVKKEQGFLRGMIPQEWEQEFQNIREQATVLKEQGAALQAQVGTALKQAEDMSSDVLGQHAGDFEARLAALETHVRSIGAQDALANLMAKLRAMNTTGVGRDYLDAVSSELSNVLAYSSDSAASMASNAQGQMAEAGSQVDINALLDQARNNSPVLGETFANIPQEDMKAAAMLFTLNQFRSALNRDEAAFGDDLKIMKSLVGEDNAELNAALDKLAPHAQSGVLTVGGLSKELRSLAGDAVVSSLTGEDVSIQEKAKARMNELFAVEKNGELVTGTDTQAKLAKAQTLLNAGELEKAVAEIQALSPEAQAPLQGWLQKAQGTMNAQDAQEQLKLYVQNGLNLEGGGEFIGSPDSDMYILKPKSRMSLPDMGAMPSIPQQVQ